MPASAGIFCLEISDVSRADLKLNGLAAGKFTAEHKKDGAQHAKASP